MCDPMAASMLIQGAAGLFTASQQYQAGMAAGTQYEMAARQAEWQRDRDIETIRKNTEQIGASQQAAMAANGIDIGSVTGQDILLDTKTQAGLDEVAVKYAADLEALQLRQQGREAEEAGKTQAFTTLLGTAGQVADTWGQWKKTSRGKSYPTEPGNGHDQNRRPRGGNSPSNSIMRPGAQWK